MKSTIILGLMSGTSLDGIDLSLTKFELVDKEYRFEILKSKSIGYSEFWSEKLQNSILLSGGALSLLNIEVGKYFGNLINDFLVNSEIIPDYIASHGHTVFHQPDKGLTLQIGDGATIFSITGIPVIYDFRSLDVARGGQGAPLVPIGDMYLFNNYTACLNFGGIANISFQKEGERLAHDICPVNMALSDITMEIGLPYDDKGNMARKGLVNDCLLEGLNNLLFYRKKGPKSLGIEWYKSEFKVLIKDKKLTIEDRLRTVIEHISEQLASTLSKLDNGEVLITGGGAYNAYLIEVLQSKIKQKIVVPDVEIIEFKEALIFAFLGWLRVNNQINVLKSVTGAIQDSSSGIVIG
jgi:anhydro-N-acetylmuramic acid kinase